MKQDQIIRLSTADRERLKKLLEGGAPGSAALRATIVLLSSLGMSAAEISRVLRVKERRVRLCRHRWRTGGWKALQEAVRSGRPAKINDAYL